MTLTSEIRYWSKQQLLVYVGNIAARFVSLSFPHQTELLLMENR